MQETAEKLRDVIKNTLPLLKNMDESKASTRPKPEKWSPKEVIGHLIDSANNNQMKFVKSIETNNLDFAGYHQNGWVSIQKYNAYDWGSLLDFWALFNNHIAHIIENVPETCLTNEIKVERVGPFKLAFIMKDYVEHLKHHLNQALPGLGLTSDFKMVY